MVCPFKIRNCATHIEVIFIHNICTLFYYTQKVSMIKERNVDMYSNWVGFFIKRGIGLVERYKLVKNSRNKPNYKI